MNINQKKLSHTLEVFTTKIHEITLNNPSLFPALFSDLNALNDPETDRFKECYAYMLAQIETNFIAKAEVQKNSNLSNYLEEWFQPLTSSFVLKAVHPNNGLFKTNTLNENTLFYLNESSVDNKIFCNNLPIVLQPIEIVNSYFDKNGKNFSAFLEVKALADIENLNLLKIYFDCNKFSYFYRFLDELLLTQKKIKITYIDKTYESSEDRNILKYSFSNIFDLSIHKNNNYSFYIHQFVNYLNNYSFIDIDLSMFKMNLKANETLTIEIPLSKTLPEFQDLNHFAHLNCFPVKNVFRKQGDPLFFKKGKKGYFTLDRGSKKKFIGIDHIQFFDRNHNDVEMKEGIDYKIHKKYIVQDKKLDIIYYLKIKTAFANDTIVVPYFKCSNLTEVHSIPLYSKFSIKNDSSLKFENITSASKTTFHFENFSNEFFYNDIFQMNEAIMNSKFYIKKFFDILEKFSSTSSNYKGIMPKIIEQVLIHNEKNIKKYDLQIYKTILTNRYEVDIKINKQIYKFGGVSLMIHFIDEFLKKVSYSGFQHKIKIKN
ncbi:hypothetical protein GCL60_06870 [Silvanigrella paludirubra]|uniref:Type VI secretion system baseplate subunit TssF n=1 Tax=Silvanigrella paludirubra TaxID=2499159 RepID=A0A6N6VW36_9BACT|nr:hypothetical protein [Silvanigrella paludirubra]KAB8039979.1 hypothetical protein GCL60_06870 [Silvanigrella paludirubra]